MPMREKRNAAIAQTVAYMARSAKAARIMSKSLQRNPNKVKPPPRIELGSAGYRPAALPLSYEGARALYHLDIPSGSILFAMRTRTSADLGLPWTRSASIAPA